MARRKKQEESHENHERWLLTYSDLITLLMIFFVIMYASSNVDASKYKKISESFRVSMGGGKTLIGKEDAIDIKEDSKPVDASLQEKEEEDKMKELKSKVDKYLQENNMKNSVNTQVDERGLVVSLTDTLFFDTGVATVRSESQQKLIEIGKILNQLNNYMRIEGHTDNIPIKNSEFSSNWQLSAARAANVTELLINNSGIQPEKLSSVGYGEYRPILDNSTEEGRARNRRVDIIIVNSKFNKIEHRVGDKPNDAKINTKINVKKS